MGVSEVIEAFEQDVLAANAPLAALVERSVAAGQVRLRVLGERISFPSWPGATSASALKRAAYEAEMVAVLDEYAASARDLIRPADQERWVALVAEAQRRSGEGLLADELGRSAVGASLLRERLGGRGRGASKRGSCFCGYAVDGALPARLCDECEELLLRRWVAEERRILRGMPEYATAVAQVIERVAAQQTAVFRTRGDDLSSEAFGKRKAGGRRLARLGRAHRAELDGVDLRRWRSFVEPLSRAATTTVRETSQKVHARGLGAAALTELGLLALADAIRVAVAVREKRLNSRWKL